MGKDENRASLPSDRSGAPVVLFRIENIAYDG
jgi:hypothetical protein